MSRLGLLVDRRRLVSPRRTFTWQVGLVVALATAAPAPFAFRLVVQASKAGHHLIATGLVAIFSILLGLLAYAAVRVFSVTPIEQAFEELHLQNERSQAALAHMRQGLVLYDAERRLVLCNEPFRRLYGLSEEVVRPGITPVQMVEHIAAANRGAPGEKDADRAAFGVDCIEAALLAHVPVELDGRRPPEDDGAEPMARAQQLVH